MWRFGASDSCQVSDAGCGLDVGRVARLRSRLNCELSRVSEFTIVGVMQPILAKIRARRGTMMCTC